jgi:beta-fructofuranosidase
MALSITEEGEGSICTGSVFCDGGKFYAFYAARKPDRSEQLGVALSDDGIHFAKVLPTPFREPENPYRRGPNRDPFVFFDPPSGLYKMLVTAELANPSLFHRGGALELLESPDLKQWKPSHPFLVPGYIGAQPECSDLFRWNDWYYLLFGQDGATHYRLSHHANGPWLIPAMDILDDPQARVMKTAAFQGNRRIGVAFVAEAGYGGHLIFRELVQNPDGTLGTKFPPEMTPAAGDPITWHAQPLTEGAIVKGQNVTVHAEDGFGAVALDQVPQNMRLSLMLRPSARTTAFGVTLRGKGNYEGGVELRLEPFRHRASWHAAPAKSLAEDPLATLDQVTGLEKPVSLEIVAKESIFDVCINNQRTAIHRAAVSSGDRLFLFVTGGDVTVDKLEIRPLQ